MFLQTWKKYLPVIILLMKRSEKGEQVLDMNYTDFQFLKFDPKPNAVLLLTLNRAEAMNPSSGQYF